MEQELVTKYEEKIAVAENILRLRRDKKHEKSFVVVTKVGDKANDNVKMNICMVRIESELQTTRENYKRFLSLNDKKNAVKSLKKINKLSDEHAALKQLFDSSR